jgi:hypothetical protein
VFMLRFNAAGRPLDLLATHRAGCHDDGGGLSFGAKLVRALSTASRLASMSEPHRVRLIGSVTNRAFAGHWLHVWAPKALDFGRTLPAGGFMGKAWDAMLPDPELWCAALRVLVVAYFGVDASTSSRSVQT